MTYARADFRRLLATLRGTLITREGEPLSCALHDAEHSHGLLTLVLPDGKLLPLHVAEACNIADVIKSVERILNMPRSNVACSELSEVLLLRLDVLREYIAAAVKRHDGLSYTETEADRVIRRWAGFLKHPSDYVFAHRCLASWELSFDPPAIQIDCAFLAAWDAFRPAERDQKKSDLAHQVVEVELPEVAKIEAFFQSSAKHVGDLIRVSLLAGATTNSHFIHLRPIE
ncbi:Hypothetical protein NGAL_HAMBI490_60500 [Neorhizobium galegae bv. officinalis]|nr:Hypothetical protein NGAL_HAMBI490_60500 [Neorhizobium galegae bv. officinalis]